MKIIEDFIARAKNLESIVKVKCIVMHWVGNAGQKAASVKKYFETSEGCSHYIIDLDGTIINCVPLTKVSYHSGSSTIDPVSGKIYTHEARWRFGVNAKGECLWPNSRSIGIEMCHIDNEGNFTQETYNVAVELVASLLDKYNLNEGDITTHHNIVGWKDCPRLWTKKPELLEKFREDVYQFRRKS